MGKLRAFVALARGFELSFQQGAYSEKLHDWDIPARDSVLEVMNTHQQSPDSRRLPGSPSLAQGVIPIEMLQSVLVQPNASTMN